MPIDQTGPIPISSEAVERRGGSSWYAKILGFCFVIFCFEIGVFLLVFPWLRMWDTNQLASYWPWLRDVWTSPFFRGALSGLGLVNIYISLLEMLKLLRSHSRHDPEPDGQAD